MINLDKHPYFSKYTDPNSGVVSYILTETISELQQHFYFSSSSVTSDGKYLWIRCSNPPSWFQTLAVVSLDADKPFIRHFPQAGIFGGGTAITPEQDGVYFPNDKCIYKVDTEGNVTKIFELDPEFVNYREVTRVSNHCTVSCDGKYMMLDCQVGGKWYAILAEFETGKMKILNNFGRHYNHAQFCPTRPDLFLIDQDWWRDYQTGEYFCIDNRIWLMNIDGTRFEPLIPNMFYMRDGTEICHDFWSDDGYLCWSEYNSGSYECDIDTREITHVWKRPVCHSHASPDRKFWVGDNTPYTWHEKPCVTLFYDRESGKEIEIFSSLPEPKVARGRYHLDPHPQFVCDGKYVVSTTTVTDDIAAVAITPVDELAKKCREK